VWRYWRLLVVGIVLCAGLLDGSRRGATPGKRVMGIRVADAERGGPIGYGRGLLRRLAYLVGGVMLGLAWLLALGDTRAQTLHDKAARTLVIVAEED
jgi:uncharacterized RDD family membrane protein YckC